MTMSRRRSLLLLLASACSSGWLALAACNTPFIPLPPPSNPTFSTVMTTDGSGVPRHAWVAHGGPAESMSAAKVFVYNASLEVGSIARAQADGSYAAGPFDGTAGDQIQLSYESKQGEISPGVCVILKEGPASPCP